MSDIQYVINNNMKRAGEGSSLDVYTSAEAMQAIAYHRSFPEYEPTPLVPLDALAQSFGLRKVFVKDESKRFGLNAFKVLGGSYAIGRHLAEILGIPAPQMTASILCSPEVKKKLGDITFVTATDGNHGRGIAWTAQQMGQKCVVFMPKGSAETRARNIRAHGAICHITDVNYDDTVRIANEYAEKNNGIMVQDTAWEGYEDLPRWIMQGYMTIAVESLMQLRANNIHAPTHMFVQAGVGSFAASAIGYMTSVLGDAAPLCVVVEPEAAGCIYKSMKAGDGKPHFVSGELNTIMAGLACGEPTTLGWPCLRDYAFASFSCPDYIAANGMRILGAPRRGDVPVVSGESGAVGMGLLERLMLHDQYAPLREKLRLNEDSTVLLISTEGNTSPEMYREVVWYGRCKDPEV